MAFAYNPFQANMDVLMEIDSAIRIRVSGNCVYLNRDQLQEYYDKIYNELNQAEKLWSVLDIQDHNAALDSYQVFYLKVDEIDRLIHDLNLKLAA